MSEEIQSLPFARRYRPYNLVGYIGNEKMKAKAMARLRDPARPQTVLVSGASGCGKTTFGRIFGSEYLCEDWSEQTGACGKCQSCLDLKEYVATGNTDNLSFLKEIDIADSSGKKDINAFLEDAYQPAWGNQWRVYILDECHMATPQAQNALLKIVEEPPERVLFIFCTTNPEMMIKTLVNRCQLRLHVKKPTVSELGGLLRSVCLQEEKAFDVKGLYLIASRAELTIREALNSLEQILSEKGSATYNSVLEVLDELSESEMFDFFKKLLNRDIMGYVNAIHKIKTRMELTAFVRSLINFTTRGIMIFNNVPIDCMTEGELKAYKSLFSQFSVTEISNLIQKLLDLESNDVETRLLLMGYTGLKGSQQNESSQESVASSIESSESELTNEKRASTENAIARQKPTEEQEDLSLNNLTEEGTVNDILDIFGSTAIELD